MQDEQQPPRNWAQMREQIDRGESGDKVAAEDPAAAPLGTDAEAGGAGTAAEDIAKSAGRERAAAATGRPVASNRRARPYVLVVLGVVVAGLAAVLVASF